MAEWTFEDIALTYAIRGQGEPVVLVHASPFVEWYDPLVAHLPDFEVMTYRRRLRTDCQAGFRPLTAAEDAAICARLMAHVGWPRAHVGGHSYGAVVALTLALDAPECVQSVALLEPAARGVANSEPVVAALQPVLAAYRAGDTDGAVDAFLRSVCGESYRATLERVVPDALAIAVGEADQFFQAEMPAVRQFSFGPDEARRIRAPVLNVGGSDSVDRFVQVGDVVQSWFPHAERLTVPDVGHLLMVQNPSAVAQAMRGFFARHPLGKENDATITT
jgi:pimeloyl-ACP methyl ester carboxylesterase